MYGGTDYRIFERGRGMSGKIQVLDCTLRDGAYVVNAKFGEPAMRGIIKKMQDANIDIVECGWLKDTPHEPGTSYFHVPSDLEKYLVRKNPNTTYVVMIDWDRYNLDTLPPCDGKSIDAIRVVFPQNKFREGIAKGKIIQEKGYKVYFQAANTLGYTDEELVSLAEAVNEARPVSLSVVDTFGAMFSEDLSHIVTILNQHLNPEIRLGFHSHNNQQLSFAMSMEFVRMLAETKRDIVVDASLCGMGRGAGNTTTELMANYLNSKWQANYNMNVIMDAIDMYMGYFTERYKWGYSIPYFISGMYCAHVNNIAYLTENHRTNARDMRNIIESLSEEERKKYDYDLLEEKYIDYQSKKVDDEAFLRRFEQELKDRKILLLLPGKSLLEKEADIKAYIEKYHPVVIGINAISKQYSYDYLFFSNSIRYEYAKDVYSDIFQANRRIVASNIKTVPEDGEDIVNFNLLVERGWEHFDNSGIVCLRLLNRVHATEVTLAGFDGFSDEYSESYADVSLPHLNPGKKWGELNEEIKDMFRHFREKTAGDMSVGFVTESKYMDESEKIND